MNEEEFQRLVSAFENASAAAEGGDEEAAAAARDFARTIQQVQQSRQQEERPEPPPEPSATRGFMANVQQGATFGFGDELGAVAQAALGISPGGGAFQYRGSTFPERYAANRDRNREVVQGYQDERPVAAAVAQVAGGAAGGVGAVRAIPSAIMPRAAQTAPGRMAQVAGGGAAGGAVEGFGAGEGGVSDRMFNAGIGAVAGAVFAPLAGAAISKIANVTEKIGGPALRAIFTNRRTYDPATGELTETGQRRLADLGYDVRALSAEMQKQFGQAVARLDASGQPFAGDAVERVANAEAFGVPLTRGQATGDVIQSAQEESMRAGVRGQGAYNTIEGFDRAQGAAVNAARENLAGSLGNSAGRIDAAEEVISGVRREADAAREAGRAAYDRLSQSGAAISSNDVPVLDRALRLSVEAEGFSIDGGTPNASQALQMLQTTLGPAEGQAIPFDNLERARQRLVGLRAAANRGDNGGDQAAMNALVRQYDEWLDDTVTGALISGDAAVLDQAKEARGLWSRYRQTFLGREGADNFIRKIVTDDLAPDQVAGWLFGASQNIGGGQSSLVARRVRDILGPESQEWGAVRRAAFDYITTPQGRRTPGPQQISGNLRELLDGKGSTLARELFTEQEMVTMRRFERMIASLVPPGRSTNPSGSGYQVERGMQTLLNGMAGLIGNSAGGPVAGAATAAATDTGANFANTLRARAATQGVTFRPASVPLAIGSGVGTGAAVQEQTVR